MLKCSVRRIFLRFQEEAHLKSSAKKDTIIIMSISFISAIMYIALEEKIMDFGRDLTNPLLLRFLPVLLIQFGMSCLGTLVVLIKNKEKLSGYGLIRKNAIASVIGCLIVSVPTVLFLWITNDIQAFLPFQGMFLTLEILKASFPWNVLGYFIIALVWGLGEGLFYVVLADKINALRKPVNMWNCGAFVCAVIAIAIHGMIGLDVKQLLEAFTTFILMYGSIVIHEKTKNAWGNILIFFLIWNAL